MFKSIKYRFVLIYFLLIIICMSIVGTFIVNRLSSIQIKNVSESMIKNLDSLSVTTSTAFEGDISKKKAELDEILKDWGLSYDQAIYVFDSEINPKVITATTNNKDLYKDKNALTIKTVEPTLIVDAQKGKMAEKIVVNKNDNKREYHVAKPVLNSQGNIVYIYYMTSDLKSVYEMVDDSKVIITYATLIAVLTTSILAYFMASSITIPIRDVTRKAREMARGNFKQKVDVKSKDEIGQLANMFNYLTDELNNTIEKMDMEKSKLDTIFKYMAEGVIAVDRRNKLIHANDVGRKILGISKKNINSYIDLSKINLEKLDYENPRSLQGEEELVIENNFYKIKYAPYMSDLARNSGVIIVFQDVTKEHRLDNMRKEFVANVSHELKTPITTIKTYTETMLDGYLDKNEMLNFLGVIEKENNRMARLVSDLLQLSNLDYKNIKLNIEKVDIYELVDECLQSQHILISEKKHHIKLDIPIDIPMIETDFHMAEQILTNIISNAVKYTRSSGLIQVLARDSNEFVKITVKDNGIGIPKEDLNRIFERFYRVEKGRSRAMGGTGLGLSIAKEMLKNLGGKIEINSEFNKGTQVDLYFPKEKI